MRPASDSITFRTHLSQQGKARPAVNGEPLTRAATQPCWLRCVPEGRVAKRLSAALALLARTLPLPARPALQLTALRLA